MCFQTMYRKSGYTLSYYTNSFALNNDVTMVTKKKKKKKWNPIFEKQNWTKIDFVFNWL